VRAEVSAATIRRIEQATGQLATLSVARMDDELPWFRALPAEQRSWVTLVAQSGLHSFVEWLRSPDDALRLSDEVFASAPRALTRAVTLQQTVELVRQTIAVAEEQLPLLTGPDEADLVLAELLRFSREIAFAAAGVYAGAAESRGSWDDRLEALVIDRLVSGLEVGEGLPSQLAALGWTADGPFGAIVGTAPDGASPEVLSHIHGLTRRLHVQAMSGIHGGRLVVVHGGASDVSGLAAALLPVFAPGPVVISPVALTASAAPTVTRAALAGLRAARGWPTAPRPVAADDLLPERVMIGDQDAAEQLLKSVYQPLVDAGEVLVETLTAFLDSGGALEATARALFVHANTVRYRLRRVAEVCGEAPTEARGAFVLRFAMTLGRLTWDAS
jgi:hypothetical protein